MEYQGIHATPFVMIGIRCTDEELCGIEFLSGAVREQPPRNKLAKEVCAQLEAYLADADFRFDLPLKPGATEHQNKVRQAMCAIPRGEVRCYGDLARELHSSPRAIGQACGSNPVPIVVPCHRVVSKDGLGGFMHRADKMALDIKRWLLAHERR